MYTSFFMSAIKRRKAIEPSIKKKNNTKLNNKN